MDLPDTEYMINEAHDAAIKEYSEEFMGQDRLLVTKHAKVGVADCYQMEDSSGEFSPTWIAFLPGDRAGVGTSIADALEMTQ